jgi:hypothetical protein
MEENKRRDQWKTVISANYTISRKSPLKLHNAKISRSKVNIDADMGALSMRVLQLKRTLPFNIVRVGSRVV